MLNLEIMTLKFLCEYDGTNYCGFQRQKNGPSIQQTIEDALSKYFKCEITLVTSGRTDAGVHAKGQTCSFRLDYEKFNPKFDISNDQKYNDIMRKIELGINSFLPSDIAIRSLEVVQDDFNARYHATSKTYIYKCYTSHVQSPLRNRFMWQLYKMPCIKSMKDAAQFLIGEHDFSSFSSTHTDKEDKVRNILGLDILQSEDEISFVIKGTGFLRNMVRIIVGTLLDTGYKVIEIKDMQRILLSKDRSQAGKTAPAKGLCLKVVEY